jgi:hypothetical protein
MSGKKETPKYSCKLACSVRKLLTTINMKSQEITNKTEQYYQNHHLAGNLGPILYKT